MSKQKELTFVELKRRIEKIREGNRKANKEYYKRNRQRLAKKNLERYHRTKNEKIE